MAAVGGTLSSYTWICLVIAFLQLRIPPVVPALHQLPYKKRQPNGVESAFADDLDRLRGFGEQNKETLGELLFGFFRFYAHEFDYDTFALSIRLGRMLTKQEKKWNFAANNTLCIEEPFSTNRNLGNTADDTSFRGLHLELRRAFDLVSEAKLEECCEQYVFPKEEEKIFQKPSTVTKPILLRSASQTHHSNRGGRGGSYRGGGRHSNHVHRNGGGSNRRASSSAPYDSSAGAAAAAMYGPGAGVASAVSLLPQEQLWLQAQQNQMLHAELFNAAISQLGTDHLRQIQLYAQHQVLHQTQALNIQQRMHNAGQSAQGSDRSRTNSLDNPPLSAPLRPDMPLYMYPFIQPGTYYPAGFTTYPSSPSTTPSNPGSGAPEFRRPLHRSTYTSESGSSAASSSLRSQSQPASRPTAIVSGHATPHSHVSPVPGAGYTHLGGGLPAQQLPNGLAAFAPRVVNGIPISFIPDENVDHDYNDSSATTSNYAGGVDTPPEDAEGRYLGYVVKDSSPERNPNPSVLPTPPATTNGMPTFGDLAQGTGAGGLGSTASSTGRRRLSTDQLPQSVRDRRLKRTSRTPSPAATSGGRARTLSVGTNSAPLMAAPFPGSGLRLGGSRDPPRAPIVANGSAFRLPTSSASSTRQPSASESVASEDSSGGGGAYDNPLHIMQGGVPYGAVSESRVWQSAAGDADQKQQSSPPPQPPVPGKPIVANGSTTQVNAQSAPNPVLAPAPVVVPLPQQQQHVTQQHAPASSGGGAPFNDRAAASWLPAVTPQGAVSSQSARQRLMSGKRGAPGSGAATTSSPGPLLVGLDLAVSSAAAAAAGSSGGDAHLSPVYENRTPSPTSFRRFESPSSAAAVNGTRGQQPQALPHRAQPPPKLAPLTSSGNSSAPPAKPSTASSTEQQPLTPAVKKKHQAKTPQQQQDDPMASSWHAPVPTPVRSSTQPNGHTRGAKSESETGNSPAASASVSNPVVVPEWHKQKSRRKTNTAATARAAGAPTNGAAAGAETEREAIPRNEGERKGG